MGESDSFFLALIEYTQAKSHETKKIALDRMISMQNEEASTLTPSQYDLCKKWYYPVIRELVRIVPVVNDYSQIAKMVSPPITERAAEEAIHDLVKIGLLVRNNKGRYIQTAAMISFQEGWKSVIVREFQHQAIELQKLALERYTPEEREIANSIVCVSQERGALIKLRLQEFRKEIMQLVKSDPKDSEQVFQLNIGFFPMSKGRVK